VLEELEDENEIIKKYSLTGNSKMLSTYIDVIQKMAQTGEVACQISGKRDDDRAIFFPRPEFANLPIKTELGKRIRDGFVAPKRSNSAAFDYSQMGIAGCGDVVRR